MRTKKLILLVILISFLYLMPLTYNGGQVFVDPTMKDTQLLIEEKNMLLADGEGWLSGWQYRLQIEFIESEASGTDYPIMIIVNYDAAGDHYEINCSSTCQTDFDDIRFTDNDGSTVLDYWREEKTDSDDATFWVEVKDSLSAGEVCVIYIYWGNTGASYIGNANNVFLFYDGFESNNFNAWTAAGANWATTSSSPAMGTYCAFGDSDSTDRILTKTIEINADFMVHTWVKSTDATATAANYYIMAHDPDLTYGCAMTTADIWTHDGTVRYYATDVIASNTWYRLELGFDITGGLFIPYLDRAVKTTQNLHDGGGGDITGIDDIYSMTGTAAGDDHYLDDFYVRKYNYPEPSISWILTAANSVEDGATITNVAASCTNLDDTDNLYARYKIYNFSAEATAQAGATTILELNLTAVKSGVLYWRTRFTGGLFQEGEFNSSYIQLVNAGFNDTYDESTSTLYVYFEIRIEWAHPDISDLDFQVNATSLYGNYNLTTFNLNYAVETRLDDVSYTLNDGSGELDRGNYDTVGGITASGVLAYYGCGDDNYAPADEIDVYIYNYPTYTWNATNYDDSDGSFSVAVDSNITVGIDYYYLSPVSQGDDPKIDPVHSFGSIALDYIADRVQVQSYTCGDDRININANSDIVVRLWYDYDDSFVTDGTVTINGESSSYSGDDGDWEFGSAEATAQLNTYDTVVVSGNIYGITSVDQNSQSQDVIWDSLTITITIGDNRINQNSNASIYVSAVYDYDSAAYDGTLTLNDTTYNHYMGIYYYTVATANGNDTYGITAISVNDDDYVIFDYVLTYLTMPTDSRINTGANASGIVVYGLYAYDNAAFNGTITLNDTTYSYGTVGIYYYTVDSITGDTYGITLFSKISGGSWVQNAWCIFDQVIVKWITTNDTYVELSGYALLTVGLMYEYDSLNVIVGTFSLQYGTTYLTLTSLTGGNWTVTDTSASATSRTYNAVNGTATLYGITVINMNGKSTVAHWDVITLTITIDLQWTIVGYNASIGISGVYAGLGYIWNGTATLNSTWTIPYIVSQLVVGNYSFVVTSITNDDYALVGFSGAYTTYCIWDDLTFSVDPEWYYGNSYTSWLYWAEASATPMQFTWAFNGSPVADSPMVTIQSYINGTADDFGVISTGLLGTGYFGGLMIGAFDDTWYFADIQVNALFGSYNWSIWSSVMTVDVLHSIAFTVFNIDETENYIIFEWYTEHENASWVSVWDNITGVWARIYNHTVEGSHRFTLSTTVGTHYLMFLINQSMYLDWSEQICDPTLTNDWWAWNDYTYIVSATYDWAYVNPYLPSGEGLDLIKFKLYVNETRIYDRDWRFYNRTDCVYNITITDFFGAVVHSQDNHSWARGIDILLSLYTFKVCHMIDDTYIYFTLTSSGGSSYSEYVMPKEIVTYYLYTANTYTYSYSAALNGTDSATYTGTITVSGDVALIIVSYGVEKILKELSDVENYAMNSGGGNSAAIAVMSVELWWLRLTIFGGVGILAFLVIGTSYMRRNVTYASYTTPLERKGKPRGKPFTSRYNPKKGKSDMDRLADDMWGS